MLRVDSENNAHAPIRTTDCAAWLLGVGDVFTVSGWIVEGMGAETDIRFALVRLDPLIPFGYSDVDSQQVRDVVGGSAWQPFTLTFIVGASTPPYAAPRWHLPSTVSPACCWMIFPFPWSESGARDFRPGCRRAAGPAVPPPEIPSTEMITPDDTSLLNAWVQDGSEEAFGVLARRYAGLLFHAGLRQTGSPELAQEAAQNTLSILARKAARVKATPSLAPWLHRTACFEASQLLRRERRHIARMKAYIPPENDPDPWTGWPPSWMPR